MCQRLTGSPYAYSPYNIPYSSTLFDLRMEGALMIELGSKLLIYTSVIRGQMLIKVLAFKKISTFLR